MQAFKFRFLSLLWVRSFLLFAVVMGAGGRVMAERLQVTGQAPGDLPTARNAALADALRAAVERGAGVELLSRSASRNMVLEADEILTESFGFVRSYEVLSSGLGADGVYRVEIAAEVEPGEIGRGDALALRNLVRLKGSPRLALVVTETLAEVSPDQHPVRDWLEMTARELQLNVVAVEVLREQEAKVAMRDELLDPTQPSPLRQRLAQEADYVLEVALDVRHVEQGSFGGNLPHHRFVVNGVARIYQPDTGKLLATAPLGGTGNARSYQKDIAAAATDAATKAMAGDRTAQEGGVWPAMRGLLSQWAADLDLGQLVRIELPSLDSASVDQVLAVLDQQDSVGGVWLRQVDSAAGVTIDVESKQTAYDVARLVEQAGPSLRTDLVSAHYVRLVAGSPKVADRSLLIGGAAALVLLGLVVLIWASRRRSA
ncbi:hypothetical protein [Actomonas aquatica]|uniref:Flagellar assembly protein T N-terminal domain-containing protein n=1 Tax=Actomonas aquatica TaxID=2866162 RepID=A0ABZ1C4L0_9BACT|nr:hypothetical protein [Opitutus sp. WL0086]WRQ86668.1 hypothetical protein K1X11_017790 [Opitutus sp. WL0086]